MTALSLHRWTVDDYHRIVAAGVLADHRCELLRGDIVEMAPEVPVHAHRCEMAARYLEQRFGQGWWARQGKPITLVDSEPEPDIAIVRARDYSERHPTPPEIALVVEYSSTTQLKDQGVKRDIYAGASIPHYIAVDLKTVSLIHYANPSNDRYTLKQTLLGGLLRMGDLEIEVQQLLGQ
jgi:Uma2 family endonuclease